MCCEYLRGLNERCSKLFIKKCKLYTVSISVCSRPKRMVQFHPASKLPSWKCWEETQRRITLFQNFCTRALKGLGTEVSTIFIILMLVEMVFSSLL